MAKIIDLQSVRCKRTLLRCHRRHPDPEVRRRAQILLLLREGYPWRLVAAVMFWIPSSRSMASSSSARKAGEPACVTLPVEPVHWIHPTTAIAAPDPRMMAFLMASPPCIRSSFRGRTYTDPVPAHSWTGDDGIAGIGEWNPLHYLSELIEPLYHEARSNAIEFDLFWGTKGRINQKVFSAEVLFSTNPSRRQILWTCVSTGKISTPQENIITTLMVFKPIPFN